MIFLEQLETNLLKIRKKRALLIGKIDHVDKDNKSTASSNQTDMMNEIRALEKKRDQTIAQLERERDDKVRAWEKAKDSYQRERNFYVLRVKKNFAQTYAPNARPLDFAEVKKLKEQAEKGGLFANSYYQKIYCAYADAISYAGQLIWQKKSNTRKKTDKIRKDTEAQISKVRQKYGASDSQSNQAFLQQKKKLIAELGNYDNSEIIRQHYRLLDDYQEKLKKMQTDWNEYKIPTKRPVQFFIGSVHKRCPVQPNEKQAFNDFGVGSWVRRDNEIYRDLPFHVDLTRSCIIILSSDSSVSATNSPDKTLAQKILCRMLKSIPPQSSAWSILDPIHKGGGLGRLVDIAATGSLDLSFRLFTDRNSCAQEQARLQRRPEEIVKAMAGRYTNLYEYNKANPNSAYPFTWYVDFGFAGKNNEQDPIRELLSTAQTGGTSFLFATTPQGAQVLKELAKECCRTVPVVHIDCDRSILTMNDTIREIFRIPADPDNTQMQAFAAAVKKQFTSDVRKDTAFISTLLKHKRFTVRPFSTTLSIPYALDGHKQLIDLQLDDGEDTHAFISGKAGSGKSTMLHTLILSSCIQYGPDSLEIWLADCKLDELRHYSAYKLPQITVVGASRDPEFFYSLVDRITVEMQRRSTLFAKYPLVNSLAKYHTHAKEKDYQHIPVLLVIIDEFHIMSQSLAKSPEYRTKLENIFREARSKGIRLVLADQTYEGLRGLTDEARKQIGNRIAMRNDLEEMKGTLSAKGYAYTDAMIKTMTNLSAGEMIVRRHVKNGQGQNVEIRLEKYRGLYTTLKDVGTLAPQMQQQLSKYMKLKPPLYVDEAAATRTEWKKQDMLDLDALEPVPEYGVRFYLGRGYTLRPCFAVDLKQEKQQNLSVVGGDSLQYWEIIRSVLLSCRRNGYTPLVFLPQASNFKAGVKHLRALCQQIPNAKLLETYGQWCEELAKLKRQMDALEDKGQTVCIFINLELAADDLRNMPDQPNGADNAPVVTGLAGRLSMYAGSAPETKPAGQTFNAMPIIKQVLERGYRSNIYTVAQISTATDFENLISDRRIFHHRIAIDIESESITSYIGSVQNRDSFENQTMYFGGGSIAYKLLPYKSPEVW